MDWTMRLVAAYWYDPVHSVACLASDESAEAMNFKVLSQARDPRERIERFANRALLWELPSLKNLLFRYKVLHRACFCCWRRSGRQKTQPTKSLDLVRTRCIRTTHRHSPFHNMASRAHPRVSWCRISACSAFVGFELHNPPPPCNDRRGMLGSNSLQTFNDHRSRLAMDKTYITLHCITLRFCVDHC